MLAIVPTEWRTRVAAILRRGHRGREILLTQRARLDWQAATLDPYDITLFHALADALSQPGLRIRRVDMPEPGETCEFVFIYQAERGAVPIYAKVNLQPNGKVVVIISAHRPNRYDELFPR